MIRERIRSKAPDMVGPHRPLRIGETGLEAWRGEPCWSWTGSRNVREGYASIKFERRNRPAHRVSYEQFVGPVPVELHLDHLCRVRHCVNPAHLAVVTCRGNILRGDSTSARNANKTHCPRGHELAGTNIYSRSDGRRHCRTCARHHLAHASKEGA